MSTIEDPSEHSVGLGWEGTALVVLLLCGALAALFVVALVGGGVEPIAGASTTGAVPPELQPARVAIGIGGALVAGALAGWVIRTTDWGGGPAGRRSEGAEEVPDLLGGP